MIHPLSTLTFFVSCLIHSFCFLNCSSRYVCRSPARKPSTARKVSKYGVFSGSSFPVSGLNAEKYGPEKTPYLDSFDTVRDVSRSFHLVGAVAVLSCCLNWCTNILGSTYFGFLFCFERPLFSLLLFYFVRSVSFAFCHATRPPFTIVRRKRNEWITLYE